MIAHRVEGIVIAPVSDASRSQLKRLARFGVPFVLVDRTIAASSADVVLGESTAGARSLVEHLIALGHQRIGMIVESDNVSTARDRRAGTTGARAAVELDPRSWFTRQPIPRRCCRHADVAQAPSRQPPSSPSTTSLRSERSRPCAQQGSRSRRRRPCLLRRHRVRIAAVPLPDRDAATGGDFGTLGTQLLFERIAGRPLDRTRKVVLPADFVVRESCGRRRRRHDRRRRRGADRSRRERRDAPSTTRWRAVQHRDRARPARCPDRFLGRVSYDQFGDLLVGLLREAASTTVTSSEAGPAPVAVVHTSDEAMRSTASISPGRRTPNWRRQTCPCSALRSSLSTSARSRSQRTHRQRPWRA